MPRHMIFGQIMSRHKNVATIKYHVTTEFPLIEKGKSNICRDKEKSCRDKICFFIQKKAFYQFQTINPHNNMQFIQTTLVMFVNKFINNKASQFKHDQFSSQVYAPMQKTN